MPHGGPHQGTAAERLSGIDPRATTDPEPSGPPTEQECLQRGPAWEWDAERQVCLLKPKTAEPEPTPETEQEKSIRLLAEKNQRGGRPTEEEVPSGVPLTREQIETLRGAAEFEEGTGGALSAQEAIARNKLIEQQQALGQQQAGQIGQFGQEGISPTGFDFGESVIAGFRTSIPAAVGGAATAFGIGLLGAKVGAVGGAAAGPVGIAIGAALGFVGGIVGGILSNMNSQRTDTTTAQQRVLDEGKQTLADWRTLAEANPSRRREAIAGFNTQLALIDRAYRQMKLDTSRDVLKFETALPNLAEFETFYSLAGERDFLIAEMRLALLAPNDVNFAMLELASRRKG